jgi:hypothetical protein
MTKVILFIPVTAKGLPPAHGAANDAAGDESGPHLLIVSYERRG